MHNYALDMKIRMRASDQIGYTPLVRISENLYAKLETCNPSGSIKDRLMSYIIDRAEKEHLLKKGDTIIESTSGNTGIALAMISAERGYNSVIVMPKNMSKEKKQMIKLLGAELIEVDENDFEQARGIRDLKAKSNTWFCPNQHYNPLCIECYENTIGAEVIEQVKKMKKEISAVILITGTGGTFIGIRKALISIFPEIQFVAVEPDEPANEFNNDSGGENGLLGLGGGEKFFLDPNLVNEVMYLSASEAKQKTFQLMKDRGLRVGIPSGANVLAAERWIKKNNPRGIVVTILGDRADRYLSCL